MTERIQPENNRTFTTGSGDWTGPLAWHPGSLYGRQGYIDCLVDVGNPTKNITLAYPAIQPAPSKRNQFGALFCLTSPIVPFPAVDWMITDGVHTDFKEVGLDPGLSNWKPFGFTYLVPADWNVSNTQLIISIYALSGNYGEVAFDNFSLKPLGIRQYLPVVGVG